MKMDENPLQSLNTYSEFVARMTDRSSVRSSTVTVWSESRYTGVAIGEIFFLNGFRLRIKEELDFDACLITSYGYEAYRGSERLFWYDDFPHPSDPVLSETFPHHKHIPPNIKRNRIPARDLRFDRPNLPVIIEEVEALIEPKVD